RGRDWPWRRPASDRRYRAAGSSRRRAGQPCAQSGWTWVLAQSVGSMSFVPEHEEVEGACQQHRRNAMTLQIGFLIFPRFQLIDLAGPFDLFAQVPGCRLHMIWKDLELVGATAGCDLKPTATLASCPALDLICIPGGSGVNALMQDAEILDFVRAQAASA